MYRIIRLVAKAWFCSTLRAGSLRDTAPYRKSSEPTDKTPSCVASLHTLPIKKTAVAVFFIGGDGGSRTHVQNGIKQASTSVVSYYLVLSWEET